MSERSFRRVAILNRGEAAMRFITAVREHVAETREPLETIAFFTEPDARAMFVREADEAHCLGPATFVDVDGHTKSTYVDHARLLRALTATRADAVWPGWGFVAEDADFAELCEQHHIVWIGPSSSTMRRLGDKIAAKRAAEALGVPVAAWSQGPVETLDEALRKAGDIGFPLLLKATAGGGGRGIRRVGSAEELAEAYPSARAEALKAFGDGTVFLERAVVGARHVEVQIIADGQGTTWALGVRDCTLQRKNQKILEETPSPILTADEERELGSAAVRLADSVGYRGAGTVEFLFQTSERRAYFVEVNARLQVEHPVTELTHRVDLVKLGLDVARGAKLPPDPPERLGHAIEVRLNAEDPEHGFAPAPGTVARLRFATGPGIRIDTGVQEGDSVPPDFDSMIAKIIALGKDRVEAVARLSRALHASSIVIDGGTTNKGFLLGLLGRSDVAESRYDVRFVDQLVASAGHVSREHAEIALLRAAIDVHRSAERAMEEQFLGSAARGRPELGETGAQRIELGYAGQSYELQVARLGRDTYRVRVDGHQAELRLERFVNGDERLYAGRRCHRLRTVNQGLSIWVEVEGVPHRVERDAGGSVRAPSPAVVIDVLVAPGDELAVGDPVAIVEAMKMEMTLTAPFTGVVRDVCVLRNVQVPAGAVICTIEPVERGGEVSAARLSFRDVEPVGDACSTPEGLRLGELMALMLGFDADPHELYGAPSAGSGRDCSPLELEILEIFVDVAAVLRRRAPSGEDMLVRGHSAEEFFFTYLRDLNFRKEQLPSSFVEKLRRALAHYGVTSLERTPELESALCRMFQSHQRTDAQVGPVMRLLEARMHRSDVAPTERFRNLLDRLIEQTSDVFPSFCDLARDAKYRIYEKPLQDEMVRQAHAEASAVLSDESRPRVERIESLVACPVPLNAFFAARWLDSSLEERELMLEALTLRYYRQRQVSPARFIDLGGTRYCAMDYEHDGRRHRLFSTQLSPQDLGRVGEKLKSVAAGFSGSEALLVDFHASTTGASLEPNAVAARVVEQLNAVELSRPVHRVVLAVSAQDGEGASARPMLFTFRQRSEGFVEDRTLRGMHPMLAKRLALWRLQNFNIERLTSELGVHLLRIVAKENEKDERIIALAEVRDLTAVRNERGKLIALPSLERALSEAAAGIRAVQSQRSSAKRLHWNRIHLFVWPELRLTHDELNSEVHKLARTIRGLGLERVLVQGRFDGVERLLDISNPGERGLRIHLRGVPDYPMRPLSRYTQKVVQARSRGFTYPYEIVRMLTPKADDMASAFPPGQFGELDLDASGTLVEVSREHGQNTANVVVGLLSNVTPKYPEGMERVAILGDPTRGVGALAEPECRRIIAALDLAEKKRVPVEWYAVSAGAKISMESGVENMDWIAAVLRRLVEFTQRGGEVNVVVCGINVGAQPYWNAEATMLMHTRGVLIMVKGSAMVLTGKQALDYSGGVSAEDNEGIGGFERVMGPNGQAQYGADDVPSACQLLLRHYDHTYVAPGERFPRRAKSADPPDRDVRGHRHPRIEGSNFEIIGDVFSEENNPGRKKPFDIRALMHATVDQDLPVLERWGSMRDAETGVVWDAHLGGIPVCLLGIESRSLPRFGAIPADGPTHWTSGTLFPMSSKKIARAINGASGNRPLVVLANLSGFDGSPESLRNCQLEYGAEIGRAIVNFVGPCVFTVVSRYHGGAFVVFSNRLNDQMEVAALEGSFASVIGGAPAAAVVFASELDKRTESDPRMVELLEKVRAAPPSSRIVLRERLEQERRVIRSEKLREVAEEFDGVHSIERASRVGAVHRIIPSAGLRPYLIEAVERGIQRSEPRPDAAQVLRKSGLGETTEAR